MDGAIVAHDQAGVGAPADDAHTPAVDSRDAGGPVRRCDHPETARLRGAVAHEPDLGAEALAQRGQGRDLAECGGICGSGGGEQCCSDSDG